MARATKQARIDALEAQLSIANSVCDKQRMELAIRAKKIDQLETELGNALWAAHGKSVAPAAQQPVSFVRKTYMQGGVLMEKVRKLGSNVWTVRPVQGGAA